MHKKVENLLQSLSYDSSLAKFAFRLGFIEKDVVSVNPKLILLAIY